MDLGTIASSAVAWRRSVADARERRNETRRAHLREVVVEFLAAVEMYFRQEGAHRDAVDRFRRKLALEVEGTNALAVETYEERQAVKEVASEVWAVISRMRLYSDGLAVPASALLVTCEPIVGREDMVLSDADYNKARDHTVDEEFSEYHAALATFIAKARAELGIEGL